MATYTQTDGTSVGGTLDGDAKGGKYYFQDVELERSNVHAGYVRDRLNTKGYPQKGTTSLITPSGVVLAVTGGTPQAHTVALTLTCTISFSAAPMPLSTARVEFYDGTTLLGTCPLRPADQTLATLSTGTSSIATLSGVLLSAATHSLTATVHGGMITTTTSNTVSQVAS